MTRTKLVPGMVAGVFIAVTAGLLTASSVQLRKVATQDQVVPHVTTTPSVLNAEISPTVTPAAPSNSSTAENAAAATSTPVPRPNPMANRQLYVDPRSQAALAEATLRSTNPAQALQINKIARQPQAKWLNGPTDTGANLISYLNATGNKYPVLVAYYIPVRDCGATNQQGAPTSAAYRQWINSLSAALGTKAAAIIIEPDALARLDCLSATRQTERLADLSYAVQKLAAKPNIAVYLDAGHSNWLSINTAAERLKAAGVAAGTGFSLGVSHFSTAAQNTAYGQKVAAAIGGQHFVIDTSRSGQGDAGANQWCNPPGRGLGPTPRVSPGSSLVDAYLWVKRPGESDGTCNGGPAAGVWWLDYALGLISRAS